VLATVSAGAVPLGVIAMVSAAIAAFFYLRVAILMYAPNTKAVGESGDAAISAPARTSSGAQIGWATPEGVSGTISTLNAELVLADEPTAASGEATPSVVPVPVLTWIAISICLAATVVFGLAPGPLLDFAKHASLLFLGH
jgi:NADH:ubiquinone oxidoreductase subunit 2 (subunit N)